MVMKRIWRWFLSLFSKSIRAEADISELRWQSPSMFKRFARLFTGQRRTTTGPNMPGHQPCPECLAGAKRDRKTVAGAFYSCRCGMTFLVINKAAALANPGKILAGAT